MNKKKYIIAILFVCGIFTGDLFSQVSQTQYFMSFPQANLANPAFRPVNKVYVGLPVLSNTFVSINNNLLNVNELLQPMPGMDSTMTPLHPDYDLDAFLNSLGKTGTISADVSTQIFGLGFTIANDWYVDISLSEKASVAAYIPRDFFRLAFKGNESFLGSSIDLSGLGFEAMQYMETSIGLSKNITEKLRVGARVKLLFGGAGMSIDNEQLTIDVNNDFSHTVTSNLELNVSGPVDFMTDVDNMISSVEIWDDVNPFDILINSSNTGVAFDIGAEYKLLHNLSVSASVVDLGFIGWKSDVFNLKATNEFSFDGFDISSVIEGEQDFDEMLEHFADSLVDSFKLTDGAHNFSMGLPAKIFLGASFRPVSYLGLGVLSRSTINEGHLSQQLSLSANLYAGSFLSTSLTYTMANRSYNNLGFGMALRMGPVQIYGVADQLPLSWIRLEDSEDDMSIAIPNRMDFINMRFGINLVFGKVKQKAVDKPMLLD